MFLKFLLFTWYFGSKASLEKFIVYHIKLFSFSSGSFISEADEVLSTKNIEDSPLGQCWSVGALSPVPL